MKIFINGEGKEIPGEVRLSELLSLFGLPTQRIAIELNREVVRRQEWENISVKDADRIEVIHFVGGG